jgi:hypothetical protein
MTTTKQVKQAVQPLLQRHSDLALAGRFIFIKPVHHILRGVYIERAGDPRAFEPTSTTGMLALERDRVGLGWGDQYYGHVYGPGNPYGPNWDVTRPETVTYMLEMIEEIILPQIRSIQTFDDLFEFASIERSRIAHPKYFPQTMLTFALCRGDLAEARIILNKERKLQEYLAKISPTLYPALLTGDRLELARILHEWEANSVKLYKIEKIWERTPFALELQGGSLSWQ